jgi:RNA polymerase sigma-70 factor (ECF subfamily)
MHVAPEAKAEFEPVEDEALVRLIRTGERQLFEVLMRRYNQRVYRVIRSMLRDEAETEDAMQQAWLQAWRQLGQLEAGASVGGWITRIASREALSRLRRRRPQEPLPDGDGELAAPGGVDPEHLAATRELVGLVEAAVDRLPPGERAAFVLRSVEGLDTEAAATALGVSRDALKVRLHRAHRALRTELGAAVALAPLAFRFEAPRCNPMVAGVMALLAREP